MTESHETKRPKCEEQTSQGVDRRPKVGGQAAGIIRFLFGYRPNGERERESKFSSPLTLPSTLKSY